MYARITSHRSRAHVAWSHVRQMGSIAATLMRIHHAGWPFARIHATVVIVRSLLWRVASSTLLHPVTTAHATAVMWMTTMTMGGIDIARTHVYTSTGTRVPHSRPDLLHVLLGMVVRDRNQTTATRAV